jgi:hypothetical protein
LKLTAQEIGRAPDRYGGNSCCAGGDAWIFSPLTLLSLIFLEWFRTEVQVLPIAFFECNENITCFYLIGVIKMLVGVECGHLPELKKLALSCNDSLLHDVPDDVGQIAKRLVKNWWVKHGLSYCMPKIEEENWVSFIAIIFVLRRCIAV